MQAHGEQRGRTWNGQAVILAGVATFLVGSFLPFYRIEPTNETLSFASQMLSGLSDGPEWVLGGILMLFAATAVLVVTAAIGLGELARASAAPPLVGAATTWSLTWVGVLLRSSRVPGHRRLLRDVGGHRDGHLRHRDRLHFNEEGSRRSEEASPSPEVRESS